MGEQIDYGLLNTQTDPRFGDRRYGRFGTMAKNGCGLIALYNVMRAAFPDTRFEPFYAERKSIKTNLFGLLGTRPSSIRKNLGAKGFQVEPIPKKHAQQAQQFDAVIVLYWYWFGAHYVAGIADQNAGYRLFNMFAEPYSMPLPKFLQFLKKHHNFIVRVWGIRFPNA